MPCYAQDYARPFYAPSVDKLEFLQLLAAHFVTLRGRTCNDIPAMMQRCGTRAGFDYVTYSHSAAVPPAPAGTTRSTDRPRR